MQIDIEDSNRFGTLVPGRLAAFEKTLGTTLPEPYRAHLLKHNGGYVRGAREIHLLHHVYGIHDGPNWARFPATPSLYGGLVPKNLLPIADDPGGNLICIVLDGADGGAICFWDHESTGEPDHGVSPLAPDFDSFQRGLAIRVALAGEDAAFVQEAVKEIGLDAPVYAGKSVLDLAFEDGSDPIVRFLVDAGARVRNDALIEAVRNASMEMVEMLLSRGIDVNFVITETGFTSLMLAASRDTVELAKLLLRHGADRTTRNRWGKTAADLAHSAQMKEVLRL
jgi:hypothetical protein